MIHIGPDGITIQAAKINLNPGEQMATQHALGGSSSPKSSQMS